MSSQKFVGEMSCIAKARRFVRETLQAAEQNSACDIAILLTSELATNVVRHAGTSFEIVVDVDDTVVRVEIHDGMAVTEAFRDLVEHPPVAVEPSAVGGRGMMLVGSTALRFGLVDRGAEGKTVWFELPAEGAEPE